MSTQATPAELGRVWLERTRIGIGRAAARVESLPVPAVLGGLVVVEWLAVLALARTVRHSGWIYYQGGDQLWYYTLGWLLGHGELGQTQVGYGWSALLAPVARIAGPNLVSALPAIELLNVLVLLPAAMLALYGIAARIGGRIFGYWALALWIVVPFIGIRYTNFGYHQKYTELLLPQAFGLTGLADFPAMVAVLVSIYFSARVVLDDHPDLLDGASAGIAAGAAVAIKPSAVLFLLGPVLAFAYRRRFAGAATFAAGLAPAVLALAVWKVRGLGYIPIFGNALAPHPLASGAPTAMPVAGLDLGRYLHLLDWGHFANNLDLIREHFWSVRVIEWFVVAGLIALGRRSRTALLLVGGWFAAIVIVKGSYTSASVEDGSVFRVMMPSFPAFVLLLAALPLLLPHAPQRLRAFRPAFERWAFRPRAAVVGAAVVLTALVPLALFAAAATTGGSAQAAVLAAGPMPVPVNVDLALKADVAGSRVKLRWRPLSSFGGPVFYRVSRTAGGSDDFSCPPTPGGPSCTLSTAEVGVVRDSQYIDSPPKGRWVYRVGVAANWLNDPQYGDIYLVGEPVRAVVR